MLASNQHWTQPNWSVYTQEIDPVSIIKMELERRTQRLNEYAKQANAKVSYIDSERKSLETLHNSAQRISCLKRFSTWNTIETAIDRLLKQDETLDSIILTLVKDEYSHRTGSLTVAFPF